MADKKIAFEIAGKGWRDAEKSVAAVTKALEGLKKSGIDIDKVFKGRNLGTITGISKMGKEVIALEKNMKGLSKQAQEYIKVFTNKSDLNNLKILKDRYKDLGEEIERFVEKRKKDTVLSIRDEKELLTLTTQRYAYGKEISNQRSGGGLYGRVAQMGGGRGGRIMSGIGLTPGRAAAIGRLAGPVGVGLVAAAAGIGLVRKGIGVVYGREEKRQEARVGAADIFNQRAIEAFRGESYKEIFLRGLGQEKFAKAYYEKQASRKIAQEGLTVGGALQLTTEKMEQDRQEHYTRAREIFKRKQAIPLYNLNYMTSNAETFYRMQRTLGQGIYGESELGIGELSGGIAPVEKGLKAGFGRDRTYQTMLNLAQTGGARAVRGDAALEAMRLDIYSGIGGADNLMSKLGLVSGKPGQSGKDLSGIIAEGFVKGMESGEMQLERESYVRAVVAATEKVGTAQYIGPKFAANMATTMQRMLPGSPSMLDIDTAAGGIMARNQMLSHPLMQAVALQGGADIFKDGAEGFGRIMRLKELFKTPEIVNDTNPTILAMARNEFGTVKKAREAGFFDKLVGIKKDMAKQMFTFFSPRERDAIKADLASGNPERIFDAEQRMAGVSLAFGLTTGSPREAGKGAGHLARVGFGISPLDPAIVAAQQAGRVSLTPEQRARIITKNLFSEIAYSSMSPQQKAEFVGLKGDKSLLRGMESITSAAELATMESSRENYEQTFRDTFGDAAKAPGLFKTIANEKTDEGGALNFEEMARSLPKNLKLISDALKNLDITAKHVAGQLNQHTNPKDINTTSAPMVFNESEF